MQVSHDSEEGGLVKKLTQLRDDRQIRVWENEGGALGKIASISTARSVSISALIDSREAVRFQRPSKALEGVPLNKVRA